MHKLLTLTSRETNGKLRGFRASFIVTLQIPFGDEITSVVLNENYVPSLGITTCLKGTTAYLNRGTSWKSGVRTARKPENMEIKLFMDFVAFRRT